MGWVNDQIKQRISNDDTVFSDAFFEMSEVITGDRSYTFGYRDDIKHITGAVDDILHYYRVPTPELPDNISGFENVLDYQLRPYGIMRRSVKLTGKWYRDAYGPMLCRMQDGTYSAAIPCAASGYRFTNSKTGLCERITKKNADLFTEEAICFYKGFPNKALTTKDLFSFILHTISLGDFIFLAVAALLVTLVGTLSAYANNIIFGQVINSGRLSLLVSVLVLLLGVTVSTALIRAAKLLISDRLSAKTHLHVESATMMRILSLPASFFKQYNSGDLSTRVQYMTIICDTLVEIVLTSGISALFAFIYVAQIVNYAPSLALPAVITVLAACLTTTIGVIMHIKRTDRLTAARSKERGIVFSIITGIQKIKLTGAEKRTFSKWARLYRDVLKNMYAPQFINELMVFIFGVGTAVIYLCAALGNVSVTGYMSFQVAYGMLSGAFLEAALAVVEVSYIRSCLKMVKPIMEAEPEISPNNTVVTNLSGNIELNNISFRYEDGGPLIIDNLSLKINKGQYVAIVGSTGCGKSTLMRILLGFEKPDKGAVYYDGRDLNKLDLKSLRRNIGTVMQNDSVFTGDIYSNIVLSAPWLSLDDAWEAAELAGIAEDIRRMPMQMSTFLSEGSGSVSGGQRQRILIARAIAPKPRIMMFDEATSALDNITQKQISDSLAGLKCTRIVIAHRLSTIKQCDRIIVLDKGRIIEDGTYDELIAQDGFFANLVRRQQIDS